MGKIKEYYTNKLCDIETGEIEKIEEINTGYKTEENGQERYIHKERKIQDKDIRRKAKQAIPFKVNRIRHSMIKYRIYKKKEREKRSKRKKMVRRKRGIEKRIHKRKHKKDLGLSKENKAKRREKNIKTGNTIEYL